MNVVMKVISKEEVHSALKYPEFIEVLKEAYSKSFSMPPRKVFLLDEGGAGSDAFALLPAWNDSVIAVKSFTYFPDNEAPYNSLYSKILLYDRKHGEPLALVDGTTCTFYRTAGVSALASQFLSRENSETMLLLGTGNLAPYLIRAHSSVRPLKKILVWGRTGSKAEKVVSDMSSAINGIEFVVADDIQTGCGEADIIVSAGRKYPGRKHSTWLKQD